MKIALILLAGHAKQECLLATDIYLGRFGVVSTCYSVYVWFQGFGMISTSPQVAKRRIATHLNFMLDRLWVGLRVQTNAVEHVDVVPCDRRLSGVDGCCPGESYLAR